MVYFVLPLLILGVIAYLIWRRSVLSDPVRRMQFGVDEQGGARTGGNSGYGNSQLDASTSMSECPSCGSEWWPDALRCWRCGYDTRAEDSDSSS